MALLDIDEIRPKLRRIKLAHLAPELLESVLELAGESGYEVTVTASSNLEFLFSIYQAEKAKRKKETRRLKKAEKLILRLAGFQMLQHEVRQEQRRREEERKPLITRAMVEGELRIGRRMRELFKSIGITNERDMQETVGLLGEKKAEERIELVGKTSLGESLIKELFGKNPGMLRVPREDAFLKELHGLEVKKTLIDDWKEASGMQPPLWLDYKKAPEALLLEYEQICKELGMENEPEVRVGKAYSEQSESSGDRTIPAVPDALSEAATRSAEAPGPEDPRLLQENPEYARAQEAYVQAGGGLNGRLAALHELGIDVSKLGTEKESISQEPNSEARLREQAKLDYRIALIFDLILAKGLEATISQHLGSEELRITGMKYLSGVSGAFELRVKDGQNQKKLYLSLQDMEPAAIGREAIEAEGMVSHKIWTRNAAGDVLEVEGRRYAISEDARDVGRRGRITIRMPDCFRFEEVQTRGAAMLRDDLVLRPDPGNELHAEFYRRLAEEDGRKELMRALLAYYEMSRRTLLPDRRVPNTYVLLVERKNGKRSFTFQPTDLDGIGNFIGAKDGKPDFTGFNRDFHKAAADFTLRMHDGMLRAAEKGMMAAEEVVSPGRLFSELVAETKTLFPVDQADVKAKREEVLRRNDGRMIGIGFDATRHIGTRLPSQGGESTIEGADGRVRLEAGRAGKTAAEAGGRKAQKEFMEGLGPAGRAMAAMQAAKVADIAVMIAQAEGTEEEKADRRLRLRKRPGGEMAARIAEDAGFARAKDKRRAAQKLAEKQISG